MWGSLELLVFVRLVCGIQVVVCFWSYKNQETWKLHDKICGSQSQSPIEINTKEALPKDMPSIKFHNYDIIYDASLINNGHTVKLVLLNSTIAPEISGGPLKSGNIYIFDNAHFHWGANDTVGSEHIIDGQRFPLEIHLVHRNTKYSTRAEALTKPDGFAVVARFFQVYEGNSSESLNQVDHALPSVIHFKSTLKISNFKLSDFVDDVMERDGHLFYTYRGSMTTPPCLEIADWIIFVKPIRVTSSQLLSFRLLLDEHGELIVNNYRVLQSKAGRKVYVRGF